MTGLLEKTKAERGCKESCSKIDKSLERSKEVINDSERESNRTEREKEEDLKHAVTCLSHTEPKRQR